MSKLTFADGNEYEPKDVFYVTAIFGGKKVYGQLDHYSGEAKALKDGFIVEDAFIPQRYRISASDITPVEMNMGKFNPLAGKWEGCDEVHQHVQDETEKQLDFDEKNFDQFIVGRSFSIGVADGSANYVLTKIFKKTVYVEWRGMCPDRWTDHHFGWGGKFPRSDVERYVSLRQPLARR